MHIRASIRQSDLTSTWPDGDLDFDGVHAVVVNGTSYTPVGNVYGTGTSAGLTPLTTGPNARNIIVRAGVRVRAPNCRWVFDTLTLEGTARIDGDGNPGGNASSGVAGAAGSVTSPSLNNGAGDLFCGVAVGGLGVNATGAGGTGGGSGGNSMGGSPGFAMAAGDTSGATPTYTSVITGAQHKQWCAATFDELFHTFSGAAVAAVNSGNGGVAGTVNSGTGTAASGGGGTGGAPMAFRGRRLVVGPLARITSRGGDGGAGFRTGDGIGTGGAPGGPGWIRIRVDEADIDVTAIIDCASGVPGLGAPASATTNAEYGAPGAITFFAGGKPFPRRRIMACGDSLTVGTGNTSTLAFGGARAWYLYGQKWGGVPWLPVGGQQNGSFGPYEMVGASGERVDQIATRVAVAAPAYLARMQNWPEPIVALKAGTNDVTQATAWATSQAAFESIFASVWAVDPAAIIIVARLTDINGSTTAVNTFNTNLDAFLLTRPEWGTLLHSVDLRTAVGAYSATNYADGTHLNTVGYRLEADAWRAKFTALGL